MGNVVLFPQSHKEGKTDMASAYQDWLLTPRELREPSFQHEFAKLWNVSEETLRNRRREPRFQRDMASKARGLVRSEKLPDLIQALYLQATDVDNPRSVAAAKLLLDFAATAAGEKPPVDLSEVPEDELVEAAMLVLQASATKGE